MLADFFLRDRPPNRPLLGFFASADAPVEAPSSVDGSPPTDCAEDDGVEAWTYPDGVPMEAELSGVSPAEDGAPPEASLAGTCRQGAYISQQ